MAADQIENTEHSAVIAMTDRKQFVALCFSHVGRQPRTASELRKLPWLNRQHRIIQHWAAASNYHLAATLFQTTTHTETVFTESAKFHTAVRLAGGLACPLVLADVLGLLSRTSTEKIVTCMQLLDSIAVDVWDASRNCTWQSLSFEVRNELGRRAMAVRLSRTGPIRAGLKSAGTRKKPPADNWKRGNMANQTKADAFARELAEFVRSQMAKLVPGAKVSPSALARSLNEAGVLSPRSGLWNHNSARNLLERVEKLNRR
ncbi:hypothetical protein LHFGNBLO_002536 [Mesorhizobium sp. AR10]|uniref:hypothetical protein n=1 Tax=Mesorhizobium sp. AR10 TaxID=2865839 RepID=UPI00215FCA97|nr:hypothetical protein [Mesorhizobium sp. AR10]UVK40996.1 hypothetical protein LHFGNBLO_002536 [Mesorhizobium sp. AR10]